MISRPDPNLELAVIYVTAVTGGYHSCEAGAAFGILYDTLRNSRHDTARCIPGRVSPQHALLQVRAAEVPEVFWLGRSPQTR